MEERRRNRHGERLTRAFNSLPPCCHPDNRIPYVGHTAVVPNHRAHNRDVFSTSAAELLWFCKSTVCRFDPERSQSNYSFLTKDNRAEVTDFSVSGFACSSFTHSHKFTRKCLVCASALTQPRPPDGATLYHTSWSYIFNGADSRMENLLHLNPPPPPPSSVQPPNMSET